MTDIRRAIRFIAALGIAIALQPASPARAADVLPVCTAIPVVLDDTLDSGKVHAGDVFRFHTIDTIVVNARLTVPANAVGYGIVAAAVAAGAHGKGGDLAVEARYIDLRAHGRFPVMIDGVGSSAVSQAGRSGNVASGIGSVPLPFVGTAVGAFNYLHAGKNAVIRSGLRFAVVPVPDLSRGLGCSL